MNHTGKRTWRSLVPAAVGLVTMAMVAGVGPTAQAAPATTAAPAAAVAGTKPVLKSEYGKAKSRVVGSFGNNGTVTGTFTPKRFRASGDGERLVAVGRLTTTLTRGSGKVIGTESQRVAVPVVRAEGNPLPGARSAAAVGDCDILNLVLGPLDLDVLGLQVHLDKVVLNIIAASGAGNLLGNLLCAVAGLLDGGGLAGVLGSITNILNSILAILRL